jgi:hypothetical protein
MTEQPDEDIVTPEQANLRQLREKAKRTDALEAENARLVRDLALHQAGIDISTPIGKLFLKAYDGEPTADAIRSAAAEYGVLPPDSTPNAGAATVQNRVADAAGDGEPDRKTDLLVAMREAQSKGGNSALLDLMRSQGYPVAGDD